MCGISCVLSLRKRQGSPDVAGCVEGVIERAALRRAVRRRGPDQFASLHFSTAAIHVEATSSVLRLRGAGGTCQPAMVVASEGEPQTCTCTSDSENGDGSLDCDGCTRLIPLCSSFLQWNGEVFGGSLQLSPRVSDTTVVLDCLHRLEQQCAAELHRITTTPGDNSSIEERHAADLAAAQVSFARSCVHFFETSIEGPYAFVYYAESLQLFLFGRDPLGRRSLLTHIATAGQHTSVVGDAGVLRHTDVEVVISSVSEAHCVTGCVAESSAGKCKKRKRRECNDCDEGDKEEENDGDKVTPDSNCCWQEVPNTGLFAVSVAPFSQGDIFAHYPWTSASSTHPLLRFHSQPHPLPVVEEEYPPVLSCLLREGDTYMHPLLRDSTSFDILAAKRYLKALWRAVEVRVKASHSGGDFTRPIGILFSGGIDCTVLAAIAHYVLPATTPIELVNVAFGDAPELTPDRLATFKALEQLLQLTEAIGVEGKEGCPKYSQCEREWRLVLVDVPHGADNAYVRRLIWPGDTVIDINIGTALWHAAQGRGRMQRICVDDKVVSQLHAKDSPSSGYHRLYRVSAEKTGKYESEELADPTSGVVDDAKFAPLLDAIISEVEAFGGDASALVFLSTLGKDHATALRPVLARHGYRKLGQYLNDAAAAGMIAFAKRDEAPSKAVRLVRPADMARVRRVVPAKWLAADGAVAPLGLCVDEYVCEARVLLLGMGADETLGGYTRHRRAFERRGAQGLATELDRDFARLWKRNLGRDDRVVCDSGRESRYPYLDEQVLTTLAAIAAEASQRAAHTATPAVSGGDAALLQALSPVCCFNADGGPPGVGDKKILRRCAAMLGLGDVVWLQKRAIQFGSRIAHAPS